MFKRILNTSLESPIVNIVNTTYRAVANNLQTNIKSKLPDIASKTLKTTLAITNAIIKINWILNEFLITFLLELEAAIVIKRPLNNNILKVARNIIAVCKLLIDKAPKYIRIAFIIVISRKI